MPASGPVQLSPPGLLGLLQLKNQGRSPRDLLDSYQPTFDLLRDLRHGQQIAPLIDYQVSVPGAIQSNSLLRFVTPGPMGPTENEWWFVPYVRVVGSRTMSTLTEALRLVVVLIPPPYSSAGWFPVGGMIALPTGTGLEIRPLAWATDLLVPPGWEIAVYQDGLYASGITYTGNLTYTSMPV
jgi:hypothetical protein